MKKLKDNLQFFFKRVDGSTQLTAGAIVIILLSLLITGIIHGGIIGAVQTLLVVVISILFIHIFLLLGEKAGRYTNDLQYRIDRSVDNSFIEYPLAILIYDEEQRIQWVNPYFIDNNEIIGIYTKNISDISKELSELIDSDEKDISKTISINDKKYLVQIKEQFNAIYMFDVTHYVEMEQEYEENRSVIGQIYLDNFVEITQSMSDRDISNLNNYLTNELSNWALENQMYLKRIDDDHFITFAYTSKLFEQEKEGFKIIDRIREYTYHQNVPLTLSMGFAYGVDDLNTLNDEAQKNLNLSLGRGGDQVIVKEVGQKARFYGGNTNPMEKRTRVRARMISEALQELLKDSDQVIVMGHSHPDMDVLGSSLGVRRISLMNNTPCKIVIDQNDVHTDISRMLDETNKDPDLKNDLINSAESEGIITNKTLIVMVDHSKQSISINPGIFKRGNEKVVVIDHHRRGEEFPENPMLIYIEPYASSTSELVTEMLEYQPKNKKAIQKIEATAMLAGIAVDTKSFSLRTGTRTFDAASYLRSVGADEAMIQNLLKENIESFIQRNHLIESIVMVDNNMAVCVGEEDHAYDPVIVAQAADTLLSLNNVEASFVISRRPDGRVGISARSLGNINVQLIMEKLGGGGHLSDAATQMDDVSVEEARQKLIDVITNSDSKDK